VRDYHRKAVPSPWLAVGAETDPLSRARELQRSWERLVADGALGLELPPGATAGLRPTIVESWRRSLATGLDPTDLLAPIEADESEVLERRFEHPLGSLTEDLLEQLRKVAEESRSMVVVTDASGLVLHRVGDEGLKERAAEMNLVEGARYSEAADGTNGIGTALAADQAFQVFAFEHFNERHHEWVCSGAPVHDPVSGRVVALVDLSSLWKTAHPRSLELVTAAARTMEQRLFEVRREQDARLRRRYGDLMTRSTDLLASHDGYVLGGAEPAQSKPLDIPEGGGEVVLGDGSVAVAASLGQGEAYLLRRVTTHHAKSAPVEVLERAEKHVRELVTEQSALRQVATLVARESAPDQLCAAVAEQVARVFAVPHVSLVRYESEDSVVVGRFSEGDRDPFPIGSRWPADNPGVLATVRQTGRSARVDDYAQMTGEVAAAVRGAGMHSAVASPIVVERRLWGAMVVLSPRREPFPEDTEARLTDFTELVATAIANAESRVAIGRLVDEQAALRRVATLVAGGPDADELFAAVADEVQQLLGAEASALVRFEDDGTVETVGTKGGSYAPGTRTELDPRFVVASVRATRRAARFDTDDPAAADMPAIVRDWGIRSAVASPIVVEGELWGAIVVASRRSLLQEAEARLGDFTDLVATAVANTQARQEVTALADEQAALRRVAVLVAQHPSPGEVFTAVTQAVGLLLDADLAVLHVFPGDGTATTVASWGGDGPMLPIGTRFPLDGDSLAARIFETGSPARLHSHDEAWQRAATVLAQSLRVRSAVGAPIVVEGKLWGALMAATRGDEPWAENAETRIAAFTELVATAIANAESREARAVLTEEQAALRRVATLVAQGTSPQDLFDAVAEEVGRLLLAANVSMGRYEPDESLTSMASWSSVGPVFPPGVRWQIKGTNVAWAVLQTGRPARIDDFSAATDPIGVAVREAGYKSAVGSPIVVEGQLWGVISVASSEGPMPPGTEARLASFTELVATAIANAESHGALEQLAGEQAALRRVATLVAQDAPPAEIFSAVSDEVEGLFHSGAGVLRFEHVPPAIVFVGVSSVFDIPIGTRWKLQKGMASAEVYRSGRPARVDATDIAPKGRELGVVSSVATPIIVEGRLWGAVSLGSTDEQLPPDAEERLVKFTELVATAIANAEGKSELAASRRRIVAASDGARRRIERDLHDGTQQRLVALGLAVRAAEANVPPEREDLRDELSGVAEGLADAVEDLQEISRGIHPAILSKGGLGPALQALAHRSPIPVNLDLTTDARLAEPIEVAAYFVASEALANAAKYSEASRIDASLEQRNGSLLLSIRDDGVGGVDVARGSGIVGLHDRVEALGGSLRVHSRPGKGTKIVAQLPLDLESEQTV
jgi:GAF domain-containing protein